MSILSSVSFKSVKTKDDVSASHFTWERATAKCTKMRSERAKLAKLLFKYLLLCVESDKLFHRTTIIAHGLFICM